VQPAVKIMGVGTRHGGWVCLECNWAWESSV